MNTVVPGLTGPGAGGLNSVGPRLQSASVESPTVPPVISAAHAARIDASPTDRRATRTVLCIASPFDCAPGVADGTRAWSRGHVAIVSRAPRVSYPGTHIP